MRSVESAEKFLKSEGEYDKRYLNKVAKERNLTYKEVVIAYANFMTTASYTDKF